MGSALALETVGVPVMRHASDWPTSRRLLVASAAGVVWAVLWVGLVKLSANPLGLHVLGPFITVPVLVLGAFFTGPVLGALARRPTELALFLVLAFTLALLAEVSLSMLLSARTPAEVEYDTLLLSTLVNWVPAFLVAPCAYWIASRLRGAKG